MDGQGVFFPKIFHQDTCSLLQHVEYRIFPFLLLSQIRAVSAQELRGVCVDEDSAGGVRGPPQDGVAVGRGEGQGEVRAGRARGAGMNCIKIGLPRK